MGGCTSSASGPESSICISPTSAPSSSSDSSPKSKGTSPPALTSDEAFPSLPVRPVQPTTTGRSAEQLGGSSHVQPTRFMTPYFRQMRIVVQKKSHERSSSGSEPKTASQSSHEIQESTGRATTPPVPDFDLLQLPQEERLRREQEAREQKELDDIFEQQAKEDAEFWAEVHADQMAIEAEFADALKETRRARRDIDNIVDMLDECERLAEQDERNRERSRPIRTSWDGVVRDEPVAGQVKSKKKESADKKLLDKIRNRQKKEEEAENVKARSKRPPPLRSTSSGSEPHLDEQLVPSPSRSFWSLHGLVTWVKRHFFLWWRRKQSDVESQR